MKKKVLALVLALSAFAGSGAFAQTLSIDAHGSQRAVIMCYDNGALVYSALCRAEDDSFRAEIPEKYKDAKKKMYIADTREFVDINAPEETQSPEVSPEPSESPAPTTAPSATEEPYSTVKPSAAPQNAYPSVYEKALDAIFAPGIVKETEIRVNGDNEEVFAVTLLYQGRETTIEIEDDLKISGAPEAYSFMNGMDASALEEGDVICVTSNIAGDRIKTLDFVFRPTDEDIVTGSGDFGVNFEKLIGENASNSSGGWTVMKYGEKPSSGRYQYAFGVIAKKNENMLTLVNKEADTDKALEIDISKDTIVYSCDVSNKNEVEEGSVGDIFSTVSKRMFDDNKIEWEEDTSYNYALVRVVDGAATDIVLYNNYNE